MAAGGNKDDEEGTQEDGYKAECRELQKNPLANGFRLINQVVNMSSSDEEGPMHGMRGSHGLPPKPTRAPPPPPKENEEGAGRKGGRTSSANNIRGKIRNTQRTIITLQCFEPTKLFTVKADVHATSESDTSMTLSEINGHGSDHSRRKLDIDDKVPSIATSSSVISSSPSSPGGAGSSAASSAGDSGFENIPPPPGT